ncbi:CLUMA_CG017764, isoform A [Clunio marinus]|uniref:CLUMA_CG017764, isoform A n=1 Tax=Clunio marinus TaxID=568069 RepID=A0A1J1IYR8_9DIPT|nr:CLUMA_CG017764, isoform A [Clunio marinus]
MRKGISLFTRTLPWLVHTKLNLKQLSKSIKGTFNLGISQMPYTTANSYSADELRHVCETVSCMRPGPPPTGPILPSSPCR